MLTMAPEHRVQFPQRTFPKYSLTHVQHYRKLAHKPGISFFVIQLLLQLENPT